MKKTLFLLFFLPFFGYSQSEQVQKANIRNQPTQPSVNSSRITSLDEIVKKQEIRKESQRPPNNVVVNPHPIYGNNWGWNRWNNWNRWGAPYSYMGFYDWDYFDRWGTRRPARIYQLQSGKLDTVISKKVKTRAGLNFSSDNQIGGWFTVGRSTYFKGQFSKVITKDNSEYYNHPDVNFYNAITVWNDQRLNDITKGWSAYLGVGKEFKNIGVNLSLGLGQEKENYQFFDEYYQLSNNGKYSFKNFIDNYTTLSVGITHDYKFLSLCGDFDPIRKTFWFGAGFNF